MAELRHFTFMESWLDDMDGWSMEDKNEALWRIINYGIYGEVDWDSIPLKEQSWYRNAFRVIDKGGIISADNAERGKRGGEKNKQHCHELIPQALLKGCRTAKEVAEFIEGPGADPGWVFKVPVWKNRVELWKSHGIPVDSKGNPDFSNGIPMKSDWNFNGNPMEIESDSIGKSSETVGKFVDSNGN